MRGWIYCVSRKACFGITGQGSLALLFLVALIQWGCAGHKPAKKEARTTTVTTNLTSQATQPVKPKPAESLSVTNGRTTVTLIEPGRGKVISVNNDLRFAIIDYSFNRLPVLGQRLGVYRDGLMVGELRVTGPQRGSTIAADLLAGQAKPGDIVRQE